MNFFNFQKTTGVFPYIALFRLTSEASTPFINFRSMLIILKRADTKLYVLNALVAIGVFFFVRVATIIPNWAIFFSLMDTPEWYSIVLKYKIICVVSCVPLDCLNVFWFGKMLSMAFSYAKTSKTKKITELNDLKTKAIIENASKDD